MNRSICKAVLMLGCLLSSSTPLMAQRIQFPTDNGLRPVQPASPAMVPINPATQAGVYPSVSPGAQNFDPYAGSAASPLFGGPLVSVPNTPLGMGGANSGAPVLPGGVSPGGMITGAGGAYAPGAGYGPATGYGAPYPTLPGTGQSAIVNTFPNNPTAYNQPGLYPSNAPSALYPGGYPASAPFGGFFNNLYNGVFGQPGSVAQPTVIQPNVLPPGQPYAWNPPGAVFTTGPQMPGFIRLFQGPRFRHAYIHGNNDPDALSINDSDLSLAFAIPNFLLSNQPLYLLPSFSLHQWAGPFPPSTADLPPVAYSAFLDAGWQSDPVRILGAELGVRVGMFSDFNTATTDSLRVMGRGIGRIRVTPRATVKLGVIYLDRNKIKLLPAGGLLWQPQPNTRLDIFFPEPKLASYLSTFGNVDTWWYAGGYYGGGSWTIERADTSKDSIDINDLRIVFGLEFGQNAAMREGRRNAFVEVGYVFDRELLYKASPADNLSLQDTIVVRAGIGY